MSRKRPPGQPADGITSIVIMVTGALVAAIGLNMPNVTMGIIGGVILGIGICWDVRTH